MIDVFCNTSYDCQMYIFEGENTINKGVYILNKGENTINKTKKW